MASTTTKKASATTELVLGQAAQNITRGLNELKSAWDNVNKLGTLGEELTLLVSNKEEAIKALDVEFAEKKRKLAVELDLSFKADTNRVVEEYLKSTGKVAVSASELDSLQKELNLVKNNAEAETKKQVADATTALKNQYENDIKLLHSENKAVAAENASKNKFLESQVKALQEQVETLYGQLNSERNAGIERAKASSIGNLNVGETVRK